MAKKKLSPIEERHQQAFGEQSADVAKLGSSAVEQRYFQEMAKQAQEKNLAKANAEHENEKWQTWQKQYENAIAGYRGDGTPYFDPKKSVGLPIYDNREGSQPGNAFYKQALDEAMAAETTAPSAAPAPAATAAPTATEYQRMLEQQALYDKYDTAIKQRDKLFSEQDSIDEQLRTITDRATVTGKGVIFANAKDEAEYKRLEQRREEIAEELETVKTPSRTGASLKRMAGSFGNAVLTAAQLVGQGASRGYSAEEAIRDRVAGINAADTVAEKKAAFTGNSDLENAKGEMRGLLNDSGMQIQAIKDNQDKIGAFLTDAYVTGLDIAADTAVSLMTGGVGGLYSMGVRVFGQVAAESAEKGDSLETQAAKGLTAAAIEVFTEKIGGVWETAYGKTLLSKLSGSKLGNAVSRAVGKIIKSPNGKVFMEFLAEAGSEGIEEALSDVLNTAADHIFGWTDGERGLRAFGKDIAEDFDQIVYDALLGAFVGAFGAGRNAMSSLTSPNVDTQEQGETAQKQDETAQKVSSDVDSVASDLAKEIDSTAATPEEAAKQKAAMEAAAEKVKAQMQAEAAAEQTPYQTALDNAQENVIEPRENVMPADNIAAETENVEGEEPQGLQLGSTFETQEETANAPQTAFETRVNPETKETTIVEYDTRTGEVINERTETAGGILPDGGQIRGDSQSAPQSVSRVEQGTEGAAQTADQRGAAERRQNLFKSLSPEENKYVSSKSLGIETGTENNVNRVIPEKYYDKELKKSAKAIKKLTGKDAVFVLGSIQVVGSDGETHLINAVNANGKIIVQADNRKFTATQLSRHELFHELKKKKPWIMEMIRQKIVENYSEEEFEKVAATYRERLRGTIPVPENISAEQQEAFVDNWVMEEIFADAYAGMNVWRSNADKFQSIATEIAESEPETENKTTEPAAAELPTVPTETENEAVPAQEQETGTEETAQETAAEEPVQETASTEAEPENTEEPKAMTLPEVETPEIKTTTSENGYTIRDNPEYGSIEISFDGKPGAEVRTVLKENKFRWNKKKSVWYGRAGHEEIMQKLDAAYDKAANAEPENVSLKSAEETAPKAKEKKPKPFFDDSIINKKAVEEIAEDIANGKENPAADIIEKMPTAEAETEKAAAEETAEPQNISLPEVEKAENTTQELSPKYSEGGYIIVTDGTIGKITRAYDGGNGNVWYDATTDSGEEFSVPEKYVDDFSEQKQNISGFVDTISNKSEKTKAYKFLINRNNYNYIKKLADNTDTHAEIKSETKNFGNGAKTINEYRVYGVVADDPRAYQKLNKIEYGFYNYLRDNAGTNATAAEPEEVKPAELPTIKQEENENERPKRQRARNRSDGEGTSRSLEEEPAEAVQRTGEERGTLADTGERGTEDGRGDNRNDAERNERGSGEGSSESRDLRDGVSEEPKTLREETEQAVQQKSTEQPKGSNYVIGEKLDVPTTPKTRYKANVEAIRLIKRLQAENRYATAEEQSILAQYTGWGGVTDAFDSKKSDWAREYSELKELLTEDEYRAANASILNAYYTSTDVIKGMYAGLEKLGFKGGRMMEPSSGTGNFVGAMPTSMSGKARWTMVELDEISGQIAKYLYPQADVRIQGFEKANIPNNYIDVAIGNVPFGNIAVVDKAYPKSVKSAIHNYFFAKTLDKVRPGGIVMFITSHYTMDSRDAGVRNYIADRADLLGAIRLPNTAFEGTGTPVTSDILILQKRAPNTVYGGAEFANGNEWLNVNGNYAQVNEYFIEHPEMVLGEHAYTNGRWGGELTVNPRADAGSLQEQIAKAFENISGKMEYTTSTPEQANINAQRAEGKAARDGALTEQNGKIYETRNGELHEVKLAEKEAKRVKGLLSIRGIANTLLNAQVQGDTALAAEQRAKLNEAYDKFVAEHGAINAPANRKALKDDPYKFSLFALEKYDPDTKKAEKSDIFVKDTVSPNVTEKTADSVADALVISRNRRGGVDVDYMAQLTGRSTEEVSRELIEGRLAFKDRNGDLVAAEEYLSGNVRAKLRDAEALKEADKDYEYNIEALKTVVPKDVDYSEIYVAPGAPWVPDSVYSDFAAHILGTSNNYRQSVKVTRNVTGGFTIEYLNKYLKSSIENSQKWGTAARSFEKIFDAMLNNRSITVTYKDSEGKTHVDADATAAANEKVEEITKEFQKWLWEEEGRRTDLQYLYNETFNAFATAKYDGSNLTVNGANAAKPLRPHQKNAVQRIISSGGNTLLAHRVGAGKTYEMAAAAMKLKELGIVKKPMFAVPKSLVAQWGNEFNDYFPGAKLLVAEQNDFTSANRKIFTNRIANGDYDAVIVSYEQFEKIPMSDEFTKKLYQEQIDEITAAIDSEKRAGNGKGLSVRDMESKKKQLENKIAKLTQKSKDADNIDFEQLGIDSLFVDEAHNFKNLFYTTSMNNVSGLGNKNGSQRAFDLYTKTRYLQQLNGGRGIVFATATPVMNSMSEMYIMQRYLQPDILKQLGIDSFDAWAKQFGEVVNALEVNPTGTGYRMKQSFSHFKNMSELQQLFRSMADVLTEVPGLKIPKMKGGKVNIVVCEPSEYQLSYMKEIEKRAENVKNVDPSVDNMLKITSDGRKISYTQRMIDPSLPYEEGGKIYRCADNVVETYKDSSDIKGTQLIFLDSATPKGKAKTETEVSAEENYEAESAQLYDDLRARLIKKGIPAKEIAFIHDADTDAKKKKLFADVNEGKVRVLIGSTGKMGVGMNAQRRVVAIHHLDAPWRPGDIEQRNGRAFRQGNINDEVECFTYVTEQTFDSRLWDIIDRKQRFIDDVMNGENVGRDVEDTGEITLSAAEVKALASGSPEIKEAIQLENEIKKLDSLYKAHNSETLRARAKMRDAQANAAALETRVRNGAEDVKKAAKYKNFSMSIGNSTYTEKADAGLALIEATSGISEESYTTVGSFAGFELRAIKTNEGAKGLLYGNQGYPFKIYPGNPKFGITQIEKLVLNMGTEYNAAKNQLEMEKHNIGELEKLANEPFAKEEQLQQKRRRYKELMDKLNPPTEQQLESAETESGEKYSVAEEPETISLPNVEDAEPEQETKSGREIAAEYAENTFPGTASDDEIEARANKMITAILNNAFKTDVNKDNVFDLGHGLGIEETAPQSYVERYDTLNRIANIIGYELTPMYKTARNGAQRWLAGIKPIPNKAVTSAVVAREMLNGVSKEEAEKKWEETQSKFPDWTPSDDGKIKTKSENGKSTAERMNELLTKQELEELDSLGLKNVENADEYIRAGDQRAANAKAARIRTVPKEEFKGTEHTDKLGIKIAGSLGLYDSVDQLRAVDRAAKAVQKVAKEAEKRLRATEAEKEFARGIARGTYTSDDIPSNFDAAKVEELSDYYWAETSVNSDLIRQQRRQIKDAQHEKVDNLLKDVTPVKDVGVTSLNLNTPARNLRTMYGDKIGGKLYKELFEPVATNEAERIRFVNRQFDELRKFKGKDGQKTALNREERAATQAAVEQKEWFYAFASMQKKPIENINDAIIKAAEDIRNGMTAQQAAKLHDIDSAEKELLSSYKKWFDKIDPVKVENAAKAFSKKYNEMYDAINDVLVSHGYEEIGFIKNYAPHKQPENTQKAFEHVADLLGINSKVSELPTSIAGLTASYKPNKRWDPHFLSRVSDKTNYDITDNFEDYTEYLSDVIYHMDDVMRVRTLSDYLRQTYSPEDIKENISQARFLRDAGLADKIEFLRDHDVIDKASALSEKEADERLEQYLSAQFSTQEKTTEYSDFVVWLDNYANLLSGKQLGTDRSQEQSWGRRTLNIANKLTKLFGVSQVGAKVSSMLNQTAQLPVITAELGTKYTAAAIKDFVSGKTRRGAWAEESDFLTGKEYINYIVNTPYTKITKGLFWGAEFFDKMMSTIAVRGAYLKAINEGMTHEEAMKKADRFGSEIMGDRSKGTKPLFFESKNVVYRVIGMFQIEALNTWEHVLKDLPRDFREIEADKGRNAAAAALAGVIVRTLLASFLLNRLWDELYGGSPAPFDLFGISANFIASGQGLTTNKYLETIIDNVMEKLGGERVFGTGEREKIKLSDGKFDTGAAIDDTVYNLSNEVPLARNAAALAGWGDNSLPMAGLNGGLENLFEGIKGVVVSGADEKSTKKLRDAIRDLVTEFVPAGGQLKKTWKGLEVVSDGGKRASDGNIQYAVDADIGTVIRAMLFGTAGIPESAEYYASGYEKFSDTQQRMYDIITGTGVSNTDAYDAIREAQDIRAQLKEEKGNNNFNQSDARTVLDQMDISNEMKAVIWQCFDKRWDGSSNPYDKNIGKQVHDALNDKKGEGIEGLSLPRLD